MLHRVATLFVFRFVAFQVGEQEAGEEAGEEAAESGEQEGGASDQVRLSH